MARAMQYETHRLHTAEVEDRWFNFAKMIFNHIESVHYLIEFTAI